MDVFSRVAGCARSRRVGCSGDRDPSFRFDASPRRRKDARATKRRIVGTVGGGRIELEAVEAGVAVANGEPARRIKRHLVRDLAMCCGGAMELYIESVVPSRMAIQQAVAAADARHARTLVTPCPAAASGSSRSTTNGARASTLEEFGLTEEGIRRDFAAYRDRFITADR